MFYDIMRHMYANFNWCQACYSHSQSRPQKAEFIPPKVGHKNYTFLRNVITTTHALGRWERPSMLQKEPPWISPHSHQHWMY